MKIKEILIKTSGITILYPLMLRLISRSRSITGIFAGLGIDWLLKYFDINPILHRAISLVAFICLFSLSFELNLLIAALMAIGIVFELYEITKLVMERYNDALEEGTAEVY